MEEERERGGKVKGREKEGREGGEGGERERERGKEKRGVLFSPGWPQTCYGR